MAKKILYSAMVNNDMHEKLQEICQVLIDSGAIKTNDNKPNRYAITRFALDLLVKSYEYKVKQNNGGGE